MSLNVTVVGVGAMGEAIVRGLLAGGWEHASVDALVRDRARAAELTESLGIRVDVDPAEVIPNSAVVVIAVKPKDVNAVLQAIAGYLDPDSVVLSVAAGVTLQSIESVLVDQAVVRSMPNTPAIVGEGVAGAAVGHHASDEQLDHAISVLGAVGAVEVLDETVLDAVTAVSGTGPAYVFLLAEALIEAAIREGMSRRVAETFVHQTIRGAGHLLTETGIGAPRLRSQVTSPGGTTAAAVHVLEERGFRALVEDAVRAAAKRSRELGSGE
jgi:pyrroline-5-carboxylate reductase